MQVDEEGFIYPHIECSKCINCNLCKQVCPMTQNGVKSKIKADVYVALACNTELRKESSSGGVFSVLAEKILLAGGVVVGAAFDHEFNVEHIIIDSIDQLHLLRGSKYVESRIGNTYQKVKKILETRKQVLFTGVPCQIEGLLRYLRKDYDNLITLEILCHGVPSPLVWKEYLHEQENKYGAPVQQIFFRHKKYGWKKYALFLKFSNSKVYLKEFFKDPYMRLFLANICLRPSCYECPFKEIHRNSDLSIGDCWGVQNHSPEMDDDMGTSVVLIHSTKGKKLMESISNRMVVKLSDIDVVLPPTSDSRKSVQKPSKRAEFFKEFKKGKNINQLLRLIKKPILCELNFQLRKIKNKMGKSLKQISRGQPRNKGYSK